MNHFIYTGQTQQVKIYRFVTRNTYESYMFDVASKKLGLENAIMNKDIDADDDDITKGKHPRV